jgi:hypothetical protein
MSFRRRPSAKHCLNPARRLNRRGKDHARGYLFSAKGAASFAAWGNAPGTGHTQDKNSAESAIHPKDLSDKPDVWDGRNGQVSRAFSAASVRVCFPGALPGALPQAGDDVAPLALSVQLSRLAGAGLPPRSHGLDKHRGSCADHPFSTGPWHKGFYTLYKLRNATDSRANFSFLLHIGSGQKSCFLSFSGLKAGLSGYCCTVCSRFPFDVS